MGVSVDSLECILPVMLYPVTASLSFGLCVVVLHTETEC